MKTLSLWPTNLYVFDDFLPEHIFQEMANINISGQKSVNFTNLEDKIIQSMQNIFQKEMHGKNLTVEVTEIWHNERKLHESHPPHCHANNDYSGIFYITYGGTTNFLDPRQQALTFDLGYNQPVAKIKAKPNKCIFFPSWLIHWVDNNIEVESRRTVAFNLKFRGYIGKQGSYTQVLA